MKLFIIGASGGVGQQLVKQALDAGHEVTAFIRDSARLPLQHPNLHIAIGDGLDAARVQEAVQGHDAVLCSVGGQGLGATTLMSTVAENLVLAMKAHQIDRIVYCASAGIHQELKGVAGKSVMFLLRKVLADHTRAYQALQSSHLRWTVVRPMGLTNDSTEGKIQYFLNEAPPAGRKISRADVAKFMLQALQDDKLVHQSIGLSY